MPDKKIISLDELSRFKINCDSEYQETLVSGTNIKTINNTTLLGSGNYEFDSALSEISTNAVQNKVVSKEFAEINYELAIIREELFETILTEIDYQKNFAISYTIPDTLTDTDGTHRVVFSETQLKTIEFNSVVMTQSLNNGNFASNDGWYTGGGGSLNIDNNLARLTFTTSSNAYLGRYIALEANRKIFVSFQITRSTATSHGLGISLRRKTANTYISTSQILASSSKTIVYDFLTTDAECDRVVLYPLNSPTIGDYADIENVNVIDLTKMFGAGNEPTTATDTRIQWLLSLGYIPYNTGSLLSTTTTGIQVKDSSDNVLGTISVPETSGKSAGNVHDYIEVVEGNIVEGEQLYNLVLHTLVGSYTFTGNESWTASSGTGYFSNISYITNNVKKPSSNSVVANILCSIAIQKDIGSVYGDTTDYSIGIGTNGNLWISKKVHDDISNLTGKNIYFELATEPTPTVIATDLQFDQISSLIQQGGTINALFTNTPPNVKTTFVVKKAVGE